MPLHLIIKFKLVILLSLPFVYIHADEVKDVVANKIMAGNCLKAFEGKYKSFKTQKAFAYAREDKTGKQYCGWSSNNKDIQTAKQRALKGCAKKKFNSPCVVIAENDVVVVKAGVLSEIPVPSGPKMTPKLSDELRDKAVDILATSNCRKAFSKYLTYNNHKAFAYTSGDRGLYTYCYWADRLLPNVAEELSLRKCNEKRNSSRYLKKFAPECKLLARNNELLVTPEDFGLNVEPLTLVEAAKKKSLSKIKQLIEAGADINQTNKFGTTALIGASSEGRRDVIEYLLSKQADISMKENLGLDALLFASERNNFALAKYLVSQGADINTKSNTHYTPFHYAAYRGNVKFMKWLLAKDIDVNRANSFGESPLHLAASQGKLEAVKYLLKNGAEINSARNDKQTPLDRANDRKRHKVIAYLKSKGAKTKAEK